MKIKMDGISCAKPWDNFIEVMPATSVIMAIVRYNHASAFDIVSYAPFLIELALIAASLASFWASFKYSISGGFAHNNPWLCC